LNNLHNSPKGDNTAAVNQPGLKDMTIKAIDILQTRSQTNRTGWFLMSEAASIDKVLVPWHENKPCLINPFR